MQFIIGRDKETILKAWREHGEILPASFELTVDNREVPRQIRELHTSEVVKLVDGKPTVDGQLRYYESGLRLKTKTFAKHCQRYWDEYVVSEYPLYAEMPTPDRLWSDILDTVNRHKAEVFKAERQILDKARTALQNSLPVTDCRSDPPRDADVLGEEHELVVRHRQGRIEAAGHQLEARTLLAQERLAEGKSDERFCDDVAVFRKYLRPDDPRLAVADQIAADLDAAKIARAEAEANEREEWIRAHGSTRLRLLLEENLEYGKLYRDERLALERPGYQWYQRICGSRVEIKNASEDAVLALREERKTVPDAQLEWLEDDEHIEGCEHCAPDDYEGRGTPFVQGPILVAMFLGSIIVKRIHTDEE
jgi:hypothetical protein